MDGFAIQASFKTPGDTLINVRAEHGAEFAERLDEVVNAADAIRDAEKVFKPAPEQPAKDGATLLEEKLGAQRVAEYAGPPGSYEQTHCDRCKAVPVCPTCGQLCDVKPMSLKNGAYFKHPCKSCGREGKTFWCNEPK